MKSLRALRPGPLHGSVFMRPSVILASTTRLWSRLGWSSKYRRFQSTSKTSSGIIRKTEYNVPPTIFRKAEDKEPPLVYCKLTGRNEKRSLEDNWVWLRDNCRCAECVDPNTMQRNLDTFAIPVDIRPNTIVQEDDGATVHWSDGHRSRYDMEFLTHYTNHNVRRDEDYVVKMRHLWGSEAATNPPTISYESVMKTDSGVASLTNTLMKWGFILVENTPYDDPDKTRQLLERIAFIRHTHYGGFYDFVPDLAMADTAYTNVALPAHTDTTYFTDPAGLQSFHLLSHQPAPGAGSGETASGGKSLLVDGFFAAHILAKRHPEYYHILSKVPIRWHASGNPGITITPEILFPVLEHRPNRTRPRGLFRIRWNNADRGVVSFINHKYSPAQWYEAARAWNDILKSEDVECWIQLEPGKVLIFDNWRVLHGRSAFSGVRRICGGYINRDDFISRWRNTNFPRQHVLNMVVG